MKMNAITIREALADDVPSIVRLIGDAGLEKAWIRVEHPFDADGRERRLRDRLVAGTAFAVVAESDGVIVGQATNRLGAGTAVLGIVVAAAHRGGGLGRRLLAASIAGARERGASRMALQVYAENAAAIALYRAYGFRETGDTDVDEQPDGARWLVITMGRDL
jgi:ribosomal protein S18 acetylase RimI-like enzyme